MLPGYFEFYNPVKVLCGNAALENISYELNRLGAKKPFLLVSRTMLENGIPERIGGNFKFLVETDLPEIPSFHQVEELTSYARVHGCDSVLAVGGSSVLDTAKAVRLLLSQNSSRLCEMLGSEWQDNSLLGEGERVPFIMVPTDFGTGSECTNTAMVQDDRTKAKQQIISDRLLPDAAVLDPRCTEKLPPKLTAACGMDALTHAIEGYTGLQKNPLSDAYACAAVKLIGKNLIAAVREPENKTYRLEMACASAMAGIAFSNSKGGLVHAIAHALETLCQLSHGEAVGIVLPKVMRWQLDKAGEQYGELLCDFCGSEYYAKIPYYQRGKKLIEVIEETMKHLHQNCGLPISLKEVGVTRKSLRKVAQLAVNDAAILLNPKPVGKEAVMDILLSALAE